MYYFVFPLASEGSRKIEILMIIRQKKANFYATLSTPAPPSPLLDKIHYSPQAQAQAHVWPEPNRVGVFPTPEAPQAVMPIF